MPNMTERSNRLRLVVKNSGKTAKELINSFEIMEKNDRSGNTTLPKDPITISRHINSKRAFDIDMAVAYGKALEVDPSDICFEPVKKNIWGSHDPLTSEINWYTDDKGYTTKEIKSVNVPRSFYNERYKLIEDDNLQSPMHGALLVYEQIHKEGKQVNKDFFNTPCLIKTDKKWLAGVPKVNQSKNLFDIHFIFGGLPLSDQKILKLYPIVTAIFPHFYRHHRNY